MSRHSQFAADLTAAAAQMRKAREHTREVREVKLDASALDALRIEMDRKLQGLASIIDGLARRVEANEKNTVTRADLAELGEVMERASGLALAMKRSVA